MDHPVYACNVWRTSYRAPCIINYIFLNSLDQIHCSPFHKRLSLPLQGPLQKVSHFGRVTSISEKIKPNFENVGPKRPLFWLLPAGAGFGK